MKDHSIENLIRRSKRLKFDRVLGVVRQCARCREWWPANREFFHASRRPIGLQVYCKACAVEHRAERAS